MIITEILKDCKIEGNVVKLPDIELDRKTYIEVTNKLNLIGGKWKGGKIGGFVFDEDPTELLDQISNGESRNIKKEFQFFGTPDKLADRLVELAEIEPGHTILEPSAGQGAIVKAIQRRIPGIKVNAFELMPLNQTFLNKFDNLSLLGTDFLTECNTSYNRIIANPPFNKNQDIDHILKMYSCLNDGGRLVTVASKHWQHAGNKKETTFRKWLEDINANILEVPAGEFKESGTTVATCIIVINKTDALNAPDIKPGNNSKKQTTDKPVQKEDAFKRAFDKLAQTTSYATVFEDFIEFTLLMLNINKKEEDFAALEKRWPKPEHAHLFSEMLMALTDQSEEYNDGLGDLFMEHVSHGRNGQFFTPQEICDMMSQMTHSLELKEGQSASDPACGSGRMLLSLAKMCRGLEGFEPKYDFNYFASDNDLLCAKMTTINFILNTMCGEVAHMNTLTLEHYKSWHIRKMLVGTHYIPYYFTTGPGETNFIKRYENTIKQEEIHETEDTVIEPPTQTLNEVIKTSKHGQIILF